MTPVHNLIKKNIQKNHEVYELCKDKPYDYITDSKSFKFKSRFKINAGDDGTVNIEIAVP